MSVTEPQPHIGKERLVSLPGKTKKARVTLGEDADYVARLEVYWDGTTWWYGVDSDRRAAFLDAVDGDGASLEVGEPDWMWCVFNALDLEDRR